MTTAFCGGGFFPVFPGWYIHQQIKKINEEQQPAVVYIHPRDIDPDQPRMRLKFYNRFMYYYGLRKAKGKFMRLVDRFNGEDSGSLFLFTGTNYPLIQGSPSE